MGSLWAGISMMTLNSSGTRSPGGTLLRDMADAFKKNEDEDARIIRDSPNPLQGKKGKTHDTHFI
jgi:hypothetical protein